MSELTQRHLGAFTYCSHGWPGRHCKRDTEGSCPFPPDADEECRCHESEWVELQERPDGLWEVTNDE